MVVDAGGPWALPPVSKASDFRKFNVSLENVRNFVVGEDKVVAF